MALWGKVDSESNKISEYIDVDPADYADTVNNRFVSIPEKYHRFAYKSNIMTVADDDTVTCDLDEIRNLLKERLSYYRLGLEGQPITLDGGETIVPDRGSRQSLVELKMWFDSGDVTSVKWKNLKVGNVGGWITINSTKLDEIITKISAQVQLAYNTEKTVVDELDAADEAGLLAYDIITRFDELYSA